MIPKELLQALRQIEIHTSRLATDALAGNYASVFRGQGIAFREVRPYQPGDDVRQIDWNVSARMNETFVKLFTEEREMTVMLLVDVSASGQFGTARATKGRVAAEIAALLAFSAIKGGDRVGLVLVSDRVERIVPPRGRVRPQIERTVVVLPMPLRPSSVTTSPSATLRLTPNST